MPKSLGEEEKQMGDVGDHWNDHRDYKRRQKQRHEENCAKGKHTYYSTPNTDNYFECMWCGHETKTMDFKGERS